MTTIKLQIYKAQIDTPYGYFLVAVRSIAYDARQTILSASRSAFRCHPAMIKIKGEVIKSNSRILRKMDTIKQCTTHDEFGGYVNWGYIKRI